MSGENFLEQQFWLYLYGMLVAGAVHIVSATNTTFGSMAAGLGQAGQSVQVMTTRLSNQHHLWQHGGRPGTPGQAGQNVQVMTTFKIVLVTKHHLCMVADLGQAGQNV